MKTTHFAKQPWRKRNLECLRAQPLLWIDGKVDGKLAYACVDFLGESGTRMYELLAPHLTSPEQFIGIEYDAATIMRVALQGPLKFTAYFADAYKLVPMLLRTKKIGYLSCDTTNAVRQSWWDKYSSTLASIVHQATSGVPRFVLVLNHVLDRGYDASTSPAERLQMHAERVRATFRAWQIHGPLAEGVETALEEPVPEHGFIQAGGFDIYRSDNHVLRMACLRLVFYPHNRTVRTHVSRALR